MANGSPIGNMIIAVDLDSTGVSKSMTGLKRQIKSVNTEMKANLSAFGKSDKSMAKYGTIMDGLTKRQKVQAGAVEEARKKYDDLAKAHGKTSAKAEGAAIELNKQIALYQDTGREISNLKGEMASFQKAQKIQNSGWTKAGNKLTGFGDKLQSMSDKTRDLGRNLTRKITMPAFGAAAAISGIVLAKGFGRLVGIDTARAKLVGLGHDARGVEEIMNSALDAVKGTSFGMDEAATTAANAVAAGVEEGKDLTKYLSITGDAAAIAGASLGEMGSVLNKVKTSNKAYNGELQQLSDRGLPVYQWLADEAGVTGEEVSKMASDGAISSEMLMNAIEKNIGGAAKKMGEESFTAGLANMWAAVGRLGASFLDAGGEGGGFFSKLKPMISDFTGKIDNMGGIAEKAGEKFGDMFTSIVDKVKAAKNYYDNLSPTIKNLIKDVTLAGATIAVTIGPILTVLSIFGGMVAKLSTGFGALFMLIGKVGGVLGLLASPVGLVVAAIALLTTGFILLYKKSETFRNFIDKLGSTLKQVFQNIMTTIQPMIATVVAFFQDNIPKLIEDVKTIIGNVTKFIKPAIDVIVSFFTGIISTLKSFWDKEGSQIMEAVRNIGNFIIGYIQFAFGIWKTVMTALWTAVKWVFDKILAIINFVMPAVLFIIQTVWGNIKGVITGVLNIIMGAVKIFSGLFTGDLGKMWEGVKQMFSGAITAVWNYIQLLFVGRILKGIGSFVSMFGGFIKGMWTKVTGLFKSAGTGIFNFIKSIFTKILNTIQSILNGISNFISKIWNGIFNFFKRIITNIFNTVKSIFTSIWNTIRSIFTSVTNFISKIWNGIFGTIKRIAGNIWSSVKGIFGTMKSGISGLVSKTKDGIVGQWNKIKSKVTGLAGDMWTAVKKKFGDMVDGAKALPGKIGDGIRGAKDKAVDGVKSLGNSIVDKFAGVVNGFTKGINNVTGKLGIKKKISEWNPPKFAKGTGRGGHDGGLAVVGDGRGSNAGSELIRTPDGNVSLSPATDTMVNLPKGTEVLSAKNTRNLLSDVPMYAKGTGWAASLKEKISNGLSKAKNWMGNVWDYAKNPSKLVSKIIDKLGLKIEGLSAGAMSMAKGGFNYTKDKGKEFIKNMFKKSEDEGGNAPNIKGGASAWRGMISRAASRMNESITGAQINGIIAQIQRESGGNQKIVQSSAVWDVNTAAGNPARGLLQYIPQTFAAYKMKGHGNIYSGYDQLLAFFNNKTWRRDLPYGRRGWGPRGGRKYATGGLVKKKQLAMLAEEGHPEMVIPTDPKRRPDAMKLLALTGKMLGLDGDDRGSIRPSSLPSVKGGSNQSKTIQKLEQSVELLTAMMEQLVNGKGVKDINQHITINSPNPISPADNARKIKQASQALATEWR